MGKLIDPQSILIREPNLLIPRMVPYGPVDLVVSDLTATLTRCALPGTGQYWENGIKQLPTSATGTRAGSIIGPSVIQPTLAGNKANTFAGGLDYAIGVYAAPVAGSARQDVTGQSKGSSPYTQRQLGFNVTWSGSSNIDGRSGSWGAWAYSGSFYERAISDTGQIDGDWHTFLAATKYNVAPKLYRDGNEVTYDFQASTVTDATAGSTEKFFIGGTPDKVALVCIWSPAPPLAALLEWARDPSIIFRAV